MVFDSVGVPIQGRRGLSFFEIYLNHNRACREGGRDIGLISWLYYGACALNPRPGQYGGIRG